MPTTVRFFVPGNPASAGSKTAFRQMRKDGSYTTRMVDASGEHGVNWRATVQLVAKEKCRGIWFGHNVALQMALEFLHIRPKSHYGKRGLLPSAPRYKTTKRDLTKMQRAVEDALKGILYADDAAIVEIYSRKSWDESLEGVWITVGTAPGEERQKEGTLEAQASPVPSRPDRPSKDADPSEAETRDRPGRPGSLHGVFHP
jgi:Holliday junction resolvase RusA-like endonuclease